MKKIVFATLIATVASIAAAGVPDQPWNHANDSGPIAGLQQVNQPQGQRFIKSDRTEYVVTPTGVRQPTDIRYNDDHARLAGEDTH